MAAPQGILPQLRSLRLRWLRRTVDQGRRASDELDAPIVPSFSSQRGALAVECAGLQPRQTVAATRSAAPNQELVADDSRSRAFWKTERRQQTIWIGLEIRKEGRNHFCIGARVVITAGRQTQVREIRSGGTYLSQSDLRVYFGLGSYAGRVDVEVVLPGGGRWIANGLEPDRLTSLMLRDRDQIQKELNRHDTKDCRPSNLGGSVTDRKRRGGSL